MADSDRLIGHIYVCVYLCLCVCLCVCMCVCVCVCKITASIRETLKKNRYELNVNLCLILYQRKTRESAELQTFRETRINYTIQYFNLVSWILTKESEPNCNCPLSDTVQYIQCGSYQWSEQNCTSVPKSLTTVKRASDCLVEFKADELITLGNNILAHKGLFCL